MAEKKAGKKLHGLSKSERLCNFTLKNQLFNQGNSFHNYPYRVFWKTLEINSESVFFEDPLTVFEGDQEHGRQILIQQNPSWPFRKIPENGLFPYPCKCLFGVSTKIHKSAVVRNRLKRITREAYRQNKEPFYTFLEKNNRHCLIAFIWTARETLSYSDAEAKIIVSLQKIQQKILGQ
jgi:ribonuclease P protein component